MFLLCPLSGQFFFYHKWMLNTVKSLFCIYWDDHMVFIFPFVDVVYHTDWSADIEKSLHPLEISHLIMVYDLLNVLLDSVCYYFAKDFCISAHQWYWPVTFMWYLWFRYQGSGGLIEWAWQFSFLSNFLEGRVLTLL